MPKSNEMTLCHKIATFFCFFSFGRQLGSKTKKRSPEAIEQIASGFLFYRLWLKLHSFVSA